MSTVNYDPSQIFVLLTLPNGGTANVMSSLPNDPAAIKVKYKESLCEAYSCLDGSVHMAYNACKIGTVEMKVLADSDFKVMLNGLVATNSAMSMTIRNKNQTGDLVVVTGMVIVDSGEQTYGANGERIRLYKFTGKIEVMI